MISTKLLVGSVESLPENSNIKSAEYTLLILTLKQPKEAIRQYLADIVLDVQVEVLN